MNTTIGKEPPASPKRALNLTIIILVLAVLASTIIGINQQTRLEHAQAVLKQHIQTNIADKTTSYVHQQVIGEQFKSKIDQEELLNKNLLSTEGFIE